MATKLDLLLKDIDPSKTIQPVFRELDNCLNTLKLDKMTVNTEEEFRSCIVKFRCQADNWQCKGNRKFKEYVYFLSSKHLKEEYGPEGERVAYEMAEKGINGGLYAVIKAIGKRWADDRAKGTISNKVYEFWKSLTVKEKIATVEEYRQKYGHLIPARFKGCSSSYFFLMYFLEILEEHPAVIQRIREIGR